MGRLTVFVDGKFRSCDEPALNALKPGAFTGRGAFETMAAYGGRVFAFEPHWERLCRGLRLMGISLPYSKGRIEQYIQAALVKNGLKNARVRLMVARRGAARHVHIVAAPTTKPSARKYAQGFSLGVSPHVRDRGRFTHIKSIDYQIFHQAHHEAESRGFDEALLLNSKGECVEAAYANVFLVRNGMVMTPPVRTGCLNGVTRNIVEVLCEKKRISFKAVNFRYREVFSAREMFITNSILEIMPVTSVDGRGIGSGRPGPVTRILAEAYAQLVERFKRAPG